MDTHSILTLAVSSIGLAMLLWPVTGLTTTVANVLQCESTTETLIGKACCNAYTQSKMNLLTTAQFCISCQNHSSDLHETLPFSQRLSRFWQVQCPVWRLPEGVINENFSPPEKVVL